MNNVQFIRWALEVSRQEYATAVEQRLFFACIRVI